MTGPLWECHYATLADCGLVSERTVTAAAEQWLSEGERTEYCRFRAPLRRQSWVAGRIAAKRMLLTNQLVPPVDAAEITIVSRDHNGTGIAPRVFVIGREQRLSLSISHSERGVLTAYSTNEGVRIGVDLAAAGDYGPGFRRLWFTEEEQRLMRQPQSRFTPALLWAAKEAAFKTLNDQAKFAPRKIEIRSHRRRLLGCRTELREEQAFCRIDDWQVDGMIACIAVCVLPDVEPLRRQTGMSAPREQFAADRCVYST